MYIRSLRLYQSSPDVVTRTYTGRNMDDVAKVRIWLTGHNQPSLSGLIHFDEVESVKSPVDLMHRHRLRSHHFPMDFSSLGGMIKAVKTSI